MVIDRLEHAEQYAPLGKGIAQVLRWFMAYTDDGADLPARTELVPGEIFINGVNYVSQEKQEQQLEAHQRFVDVMYVVEGEERIFYQPFCETACVTMPYDAQKECALARLDADAATQRFSAGHFLIFFPQDGHLAAQLWDKPCKVRKFIAKVAVDSL